MQLSHHTLRNAICLALLLVLATVCPVVATSKPSATLLTKDSLTTPKQSASIEAKLSMPATHVLVGLAGEPLELLRGNDVVASAVTGKDGRALFHYAHKARGNTKMIVRTAEHSTVSSSESLTMAVWERRTPILMVEMSALFENPAAPEPLADAAEELGKLTRFYYNVIYVVSEGDGTRDAYQASNRARDWLSTHKFPLGYVLALPSSAEALGKKIDELRDTGWTTLKVGVGRTRPFAEAFIQRRLEAVMVPEPAKAERPRKAKVAKVWKDVRKNF